MTALLFYPLLGGTGQTSGLPRWLEGYGERSAPQSAVVLLRALPQLSDAERPIARFLLAGDLAELGLGDLAARQLASLTDSPELGAGAFLALARVRDEDGEDDALHAAAERAPWRRLDDESFGEAATHVARACMRAGRYVEAREWLRRVPASSSFFGVSRVLLVQTEYALGRAAAALEAADRAFDAPARSRSSRWLEDRTAILVGELLTEIGLYSDAIDVLDWPAATSPFRSRADRDRELARVMQATAEGFSAEPADAADTELEREITRATRSEAALSARVAELRASWPSPALRAERRRWVETVATRAFERERPFDWRRALDVVWRSFPPVALYQLARRHPTVATEDDPRTVGAETRFFFAPDRHTSRLLVALALVSEGVERKACPDLAAQALAARVADAAAGTAAAPTLAELTTVANGCEPADTASIREALEEELRRAIAAESSRQVLEIRERRRRLAEAVASAEVDRAATLRAAGGPR